MPFLSKYVVFVVQAEILSFSHPTSNKAYVELIGVEKTYTYLQCIYCLIKQWTYKNLSYKSTQDVHVCGCKYVVVAKIWWRKYK
jgi:hypothetical protein